MNSEVNTVPENMEEAVNENTEITAPEKTEIDIKNMDFFSSMKKSYPVTNDTTVEFFSILVSFVITLITIMAVGLIPVNTSTDSYKGILTTEAMSNCRPEPLEMPMYILTVVLVPLVFLASYCILKKRLAPVPIMLNNTTQFIILFVICAVSFFAYYFTRNATVHFQNAFNLSIFLIVPVTAVVLFTFAAAEKIKKKNHQKIIFFAVLTVVFSYSIWRIVTINYACQSGLYNYHHYYAVWYPIVKVSDGQTIGTDFQCIYGFYPYIAVPILRLFGGVNQQSSSILIALLLTIVAFTYCAFSYKFIKNKIIALIVSLACSLYGPFSILGDHSNGGVKMYLQYNPLRSICIAAALLAILIRSSIKSKRWVLFADIITSLVLGLAVVCNFETGTVAVIIWGAYRVFSTALENKLFSKKTFIELIKAFLCAAVSFAEFFILISVITFVRSGQLLSVNEMFFGITTFTGAGFYMIKMGFGVWIVMAVIFAVSLMKTIPYLTKYKDVPDKMKNNITGLFIASVTGIGVFTYFVGRSHPSNSLNLIPSAVLCCGLLYEYIRFISEIKQSDNTTSTKILNNVKRVMCIIFISAVLIPTGANVVNSFTPKFAKDHYPGEKTLVKINARATAIKKWADENNNGIIPNNLLNYSIYTNEQLGKKSYEKVCEQIDWFYLDNLRTYLEFMKKHSDECFVISATAVTDLKVELKEEWDEAAKNFKRAKKIKNSLYGDFIIYTPKNFIPVKKA